MSNITRVKKGESLLSGTVLVTCTVTIFGLWSHSGTGEEWADDDNSVTSADAQAFKRACSCFGQGRYFYDLPAVQVDLGEHRQPVKTLVLPAWALPENWRKGMRPRERGRAQSGGARQGPKGRKRWRSEKGQLVGMMVTTASAVTVQRKSLMAHQRRVPTMSSISATNQGNRRTAFGL